MSENAKIRMRFPDGGSLLFSCKYDTHAVNFWRAPDPLDLAVTALVEALCDVPGVREALAKHGIVYEAAKKEENP